MLLIVSIVTFGCVVRSGRVGPGGGCIMKVYDLFSSVCCFLNTSLSLFYAQKYFQHGLCGSDEINIPNKSSATNAAFNFISRFQK